VETRVSQRLIVITAVFVTCLITANIVAVKWFSAWGMALPAAVVVFPLSYVVGDVLTEVYGYRQARRVIWLGFFCNLIFVTVAWIGLELPPASFWGEQSSYEAILGRTPRILIASLLGYLVGEFANSFTLAKMKIRTRGRWLWSRTIGSTIVGEGLDSAIFITVLTIGTPWFVPISIVYHWIVKTAFEAVATPLTYVVVNYLKRKEGIDTYDYDTNFNPFLVTN